MSGVQSEKIRALRVEFSRKLSLVELDELQANQVCVPRRIIPMGAGSFSITLPKAWCRAHDLKRHDEVLVQFDPSGILKVHPPQNRLSQGDAKTIE